MNTGRYERTDEHQGYRSDHDSRKLITGARELELRETTLAALLDDLTRTDEPGKSFGSVHIV